MQGPDQGLAINSTSFQPKVDLLELKGAGFKYVWLPGKRSSERCARGRGPEDHVNSARQKRQKQVAGGSELVRPERSMHRTVRLKRRRRLSRTGVHPLRRNQTRPNRH